MIELWNYRFGIHMRGGSKRDVWGLIGNVINHPRFPYWDEVMVSTPVDLDEVTGQLITASGRVYELRQPEGDREAIHDEIRRVIQQGCYERR